MTTNYPSGLDNLAPGRGNPGDTLASPDHVQHHHDEDDAIQAIQTYLGIIGSAVTSTITYLLTNVLSIDPGHKHTKNSVTLALSELSDTQISSPSDGNGLFYNATAGKWEPGNASVADASATVIGVTKLSVAPASPTIPIAVGDNDPRFTTTSGTTLDGSADKIVDSGDVDAAATANKVARRNSNGDVVVPSTPGSSTAAASKSYVDTGDSFVAGSLSALLATTAGNNDATVTTTFTPRLIRLRYWIQGYDSAASNYTQAKGVALYNGTTLISNDVLWTNDNVADQGGAISAASLANDPTSTSAPTAGTGTGITLTLTIPTVTSTGFTIRRATVHSGQNARANISYEAFA